MSAVPEKVSVREFRTHMARYMGSPSPVVVTRHGETIGYYIPARPSPENRELDALKQAASRLDSVLAEAGVSEEEMLMEFRKLRSRDDGSKSTGARR